MEGSLLKLYDRLTLKRIALENGLSKRGFNGRNISKMRKQDFIDFILSKEEEEDEGEILIMSSLLQDFNLLSIFNCFLELGNDNNIEKKCIREPKEEDEAIPNLEIKELIATSCNNSDCTCENCNSNKLIIEENLKVKTNLSNLENKITCVICQINMKNTIFQPCNHLATCITCSKNSLLKKQCPVCTKPFEKLVRVFF